MEGVRGVEQVERCRGGRRRWRMIFPVHIILKTEELSSVILSVIYNIASIRLLETLEWFTWALVRALCCIWSSCSSVDR